MGFFGKLTAAVIQTAILPIEIVKDVATLGGAINDNYGVTGHTYTGKRIKEIEETVDDAIDDLKR